MVSEAPAPNKVKSEVCVKQRIGVLVFIFLCSSLVSLAQAPTAVVNGQVRDTSGAALPQASVEVINDSTNLRYTTETNDEGIYSVPNLLPGTYHIRVSKQGFKTIVHPDITLNVQDAKAIGFTLPVGPISDTVTVEGGASLIDTESAAVSTVVDRQFAENLPLNGRSFQTLIQLTPGVVLTANNGVDIGQFSVNGQRAASNYWMVDGVSANIGMTTVATPSNGVAGAVGSFSALGGTNSLVSVDALQEFRIQTSTFAPEFGRTPGGQISIVTRSGANAFHGTAFDYLRNDVFDANNWFNTAVTPALPKAQERQNDFGGTFSGRIIKDRSFFFFSYEGLRLRLPQTELTNVPDLSARAAAVSAMQPFLNAYPVPNGSDNVSTGVALFNSSFSNPATLDAYSLRIDHKPNQKVSIFGRYDYSPSELDARGSGGTSLSTVFPARIITQTGTAGLTWSMSSATVNDFRFNYSRTNASASVRQDNFGGAVQLSSLPFPSGFSNQNASFAVLIFPLGLNNGALLQVGHSTTNLQRQINVVDNVSVQKSSHSLKFGVDFRRLSPQVRGFEYAQEGVFATVPRAESGNTAFTRLFSRRDIHLILHNLGVFAQDTWRISPRLTVTYGLRWDVDFAPSSVDGPSFPAATGFDLGNLSALALAPAGTPSYKTTYGNLSPRIGLAYELSSSQDWQTVLRGGFGVFYDLATTETGNIVPLNFYPFGTFVTKFGASFPLTSGAGAPPLISPPALGTGQIFAFDPNLQLPYTLQWNVGLEQALGRQQIISATYIGSAGRRLIQTANISQPNPNYAGAQIATNASTSNYNALQLQFQRRLSRGLRALASYSWSHSIDTASASSFGSGTNALIAFNPNVNRGPSDFDIRNAFSIALTYDVPAPKNSAFANAIMRGWSTENILQVRSAPPVDADSLPFFPLSDGFITNVRPDVVPGIPLYLHGSQYPGGKAFNPNAFTNPPTTPAGCNPATDFPCNPTRQGNLGRNALRGFGATQWDFAVHRDFPFHESLKLQFRAEMFNVLNHPNFAPPIGDLTDPRFGQSIQLLGQGLSGAFGMGGGAFNPLYQIGGPRSIQFALKLIF